MKIEWLYWAAGLLDGEGCFTLAKSKQYKYPRVICNMTDQEPIKKLQELFGGSLYQKKTRSGYKTAWYWEIGSARAVAVMMTLFPLLCPRRQARIKEILLVWKDKIPYQKEKCRHGHTYTPETSTYAYKFRKGVRRKYRLCRICLSERGDIRAKGKSYYDVPEVI